MKISFKDILLPLGLALMVTWGIQYFFMYRSSDLQNDTAVVSGQSFVAPQTKQALKPLNVEIDFFDEQQPLPTRETTIETVGADYVFSTDGAALQSVVYKIKRNGNIETITTITPHPEDERETQCFLLALAEKTPYYYELVNKKDTPEATSLVYQTQTDQAVISKTFIVYKNTYKIDLTIDITPKNTDLPLEARLFFPAPQMPELGRYDTVSAIMNDAKGTIKTIARNSLDVNQGRYTPSFFGVDNRYFVDALVADPQHFAYRGYYKLTGKNDLFAILESPEIAKQTSWNLSFYFGPKEEAAMAAVDPRLEQTLAYSGWFAFISKFLLKVLEFLYKYLGNYGFAIIALTLIIRLIMVPFTLNAFKHRKKGSECRKKIQYLKQKYKNDPERLAQEQAALLKKHGLPGIGGCLPVLLQLPIFIGLSRVLNNSFELYHAPFFWIKDLSASDPYYILPSLIFLAMLAQGVTIPGTKESRLPLIIMAFVFPAIAANFSAGLALYIVISTVFSILQAILTTDMKRV